MTLDSLESHVLSSLTKILEKYRQIDTLANQMLTESDSITDLDQQMVKLNSERESVAVLHHESRSLHEQYRSSRPTASPEVKQLTESIGQLMQKLLMIISQLEQRAKGSCEQLVPQIHDGVKALQMKNAYTRYS